MDRYCSSMVHLLRGRELDARNALTDNIRQCSKHRRWHTCENIGVYDRHFDESRLLYFVMCQGAIRAINDMSYNDTTTHAHESLRGIYSLNVVKLTNDIVTSKPQDSLFRGKFTIWKGQEMNVAATFAFSLFRRSRLLERMPRVERTCVRPQIADQRPT